MKVPLSECISPNFVDLHKAVKSEEYTEYWLRGGRGSTKSSFVSLEIILGILRDPKANVVVFRRYENEIRDSVFGQLTWAINKLGIEESFKFQVSPFKIIYKPTGQQIIFKGSDNPLKIKSINLGKGYIKYAWFEEVDQFGGMEELRNILQSIFRGTMEKQISFYSYNPPKSARSWANAETKIEKPGRIVHHSDYRDVPREWLGTTFLENAMHLKITNPEAYRHEYLGEEIGTGLEVFNNVTLRTIPDGEIQYFDNYYQGLDFGYAADPMAFGQKHFDSKRKTLYIFFEITGHGLKNSVFVDMLTPEQKANLTMADGAEPKSIDELHQDYGMNIMGAKKGPGSVEHGIKWLKDLEEIVIDPERCPLAAKEFINYALQVNQNGEVISKYPDKDNHCFTGDTMISTLVGHRRIDEIKVGELVHTRMGLRPVTKVFDNGLKEVVTIKLLNGKSLTLTDTHHIITKAGEVEFRDLSSSDFVYYEVDGWKIIETENRKLSFIVAKNIDAIRIVRGVLTGYITSDLYKAEKGSTSILQSIEMRLVRFQRIITYTIKMVTLLITLSGTWPVWKVLNICRNISKSTVKSIRKLSEKILTIFGTSRKSGMLQKKAENGIGSMRKKSSRIDRLSPETVITAGKVMKSMTFPQKVIPGSAQTSVNPPGEELLVSTMYRESVPGVGRPSRSTNILNRNSVPVRVERVYDIEVEGAHEYFANGLLVHNCIDAVRYGCVHLINTARAEKRRSKFKANPIPVLSRW